MKKGRIDDTLKDEIKLDKITKEHYSSERQFSN